jgi:hypothetical protein
MNLEVMDARFGGLNESAWALGDRVRLMVLPPKTTRDFRIEQSNGIAERTDRHPAAGGCFPPPKWGNPIQPRTRLFRANMGVIGLTLRLMRIHNTT